MAIAVYPGLANSEVAVFNFHSPAEFITAGNWYDSPATPTPQQIIDAY